MQSVSHGYKDIKVKVDSYHKDIAKHIWNCYRMTWSTLQNVEYDVNNKDVIDAVKNVIEFKALPMPREQCSLTFRIENISRVCLAQLTRQRKAAFNVESQMPQAVKHNVILPVNIANSEYAVKALNLINESQNLYDALIADGFPYQDARYILMHGQTTSCVYCVDINTFIGSFAMRCENNLSDEINLVYRLCLYELKKEIQAAYNSNEIDDLTYLFYTETLKNCDCLGSKQKLGLNTDKVFGNSFERYASANKEVIDSTKNSTCDFKKSAWYAELIELYLNRPELLFDKEKEMIEKWI